MQHNSENRIRSKNNEHCECQCRAVWLAEKHHQYAPCLYFSPRTLTSQFCTHLSKVFSLRVRGEFTSPDQDQRWFYDPFSDVIIFSRNLCKYLCDSCHIDLVLVFKSALQMWCGLQVIMEMSGNTKWGSCQAVIRLSSVRSSCQAVIRWLPGKTVICIC